METARQRKQDLKGLNDVEGEEAERHAVREEAERREQKEYVPDRMLTEISKALSSHPSIPAETELAHTEREQLAEIMIEYQTETTTTDGNKRTIRNYEHSTIRRYTCLNCNETGPDCHRKYKRIRMRQECQQVPQKEEWGASVETGKRSHNAGKLPPTIHLRRNEGRGRRNKKRETTKR